MTRINVVPPDELCDQHLIAEWRELTRIPNTVKSGKARVDQPIPETYRLGKGHVTVFYNKLGWLERRYRALLAEGARRGLNLADRWPDGLPADLCGDLEVRPEDMAANRARISERLAGMNPRWSV